MNQFQLIEIIGNKDVVTVIQSYMSGTPLINLDDDTDDVSSDDEVEDIQKEIDICKIRTNIRYAIRGQIFDLDEDFNTRCRCEKRILSIPDVEPEPTCRLKINNTQRRDELLLFYGPRMNLEPENANVFRNSSLEISYLVKYNKAKRVIDYLSDKQYEVEFSVLRSC